MPPLQHYMLHLWQVSFIAKGDEFSEIIVMTEPNARLVAQYLKDRESEGNVEKWGVVHLSDEYDLRIRYLVRLFEDRWGIKLDYFMPGSTTKRSEM